MLVGQYPCAWGFAHGRGAMPMGVGQCPWAWGNAHERGASPTGMGHNPHMCADLASLLRRSVTSAARVRTSSSCMSYSFLRSAAPCALSYSALRACSLPFVADGAARGGLASMMIRLSVTTALPTNVLASETETDGVLMLDELLDEELLEEEEEELLDEELLDELDDDVRFEGGSSSTSSSSPSSSSSST